MVDKKYYWLKLPSNYFSHLEQKKMKRCEHGKDMQIIYLRMLLLSLDRSGYICYQGVYDSLEEELAEEFDEPVELIRETLDFLKNNNMISIDENSDCFVPESLKLTGSECSSAERVRRHRDAQKALQCNRDVTGGNACNTAVTECNTEIEKREERDLEKREEGEKDTFCTELDKSHSMPPVISLPLNDKTLFKIFENDLTGWQELYPAVDILQELRKMKGWLDSNPTRRKTKNGIRKFINGWLSKEQDKQHSSTPRNKNKNGLEDFIDD